MIRTPTPIRRGLILLIALVVAGVLLPGRMARAADADATKHEVKFNAHPGDRWDFDVNQKSSSKTEITSAGEQHTVEQSLSYRRKGTMEVLAAKDGTPMAVKVSFDKDCATSANNGEAHVSPAFPLAGKTITIRRDEAGKVTSDAEEIDANTTQEIDRLLDPDKSLYPPRPVSVGEEWPADTTALSQQFKLVEGDSISIKCKLLAIGKVAGRSTADIFAAGRISKNEQGIVTRIDLSGVSQVDLATGQTLQSDVMGKITVKGNRGVQGPNGEAVAIQAAGDGTLEQHQTVRPAEALAGGHADNPPPTGADFPAPGPVPAPAGHGDVGAFAGTFKDEALTADFHQVPEGVAGTLTLHDKKLPAAARVEGGKLVGTFETGGSKFEFTASVDGNVMTLKSGSKTYTLKKPAENPLDPGGAEQPKPKNPLDLLGQ